MKLFPTLPRLRFTRPYSILARLPAQHHLCFPQNGLVRHFGAGRASRVPAAAPTGLTEALPLNCPGCGAFSQIEKPGLPGYFRSTRKGVKDAVAQSKSRGTGESRRAELELFQQSLARIGDSPRDGLKLELEEARRYSFSHATATC